MLCEAPKNALEAFQITFPSLSEAWECLGSLIITRRSDSGVWCAVTTVLNLAINLH